jgi:hypothetical protein
MKIRKIIVFIALIFCLTPQLAVAQQQTDPVTGRPVQQGGPQRPANCVDNPPYCTGQFCEINGICVPIPKVTSGAAGANTVFELVSIVLRWLFTFAGIIATVFIIIGGYQYLTSGGNEESAEKGKKTLINAVIGLVAVILAITIVTIVTNTLGQNNPVGQNRVNKILV